MRLKEGHQYVKNTDLLLWWGNMVLSYFLYTLAVTGRPPSLWVQWPWNFPNNTISQTAMQLSESLWKSNSPVRLTDTFWNWVQMLSKHVKWSSRKKGWFVAARWISAALVISSLRLSKPVIQTIQSNAFSMIYSYYQISTEPTNERTYMCLEMAHYHTCKWWIADELDLQWF